MDNFRKISFCKVYHKISQSIGLSVYLCMLTCTKARAHLLMALESSCLRKAAKVRAKWAPVMPLREMSMSPAFSPQSLSRTHPPATLNCVPRSAGHRPTAPIRKAKSLCSPGVSLNRGRPPATTPILLRHLPAPIQCVGASVLRVCRREGRRNEL